MKIKYWGTAAAEGVPGIFCNCETCRLAREHKGRKVRTRSQLMINDELMIDFGPDTYYNSLRFDYNLTYLEHLLITHPHEDHLYSEEFWHRLKGYACEIGTPSLTVHGSEDTLAKLCEVDKNVKGFQKQERVLYDVMKPYETRQIGRYMVTPLPACHSTKQPFVYLIEEGEKSFLLLNDTGRPSYDVYEYLIKRGVVLNAISFDTTYGNENVLATYGAADHHMGLMDAVAVKSYLDINGVSNADTVCIVTHFSHQGVDADYDKMCAHSEKFGFIVSYDGLEIVI